MTWKLFCITVQIPLSVKGEMVQKRAHHGIPGKRVYWSESKWNNKEHAKQVNNISVQKQVIPDTGKYSLDNVPKQK